MKILNALCLLSLFSACGPAEDKTPVNPKQVSASNAGTFQGDASVSGDCFSRTTLPARVTIAAEEFRYVVTHSELPFCAVLGAVPVSPESATIQATFCRNGLWTYEVSGALTFEATKVHLALTLHGSEMNSARECSTSVGGTYDREP